MPGDTPTLTPTLTDTSSTDTNGATGIQDAVLSTDLPLASLIQISALPPATTSPQAVLPKRPYHRQLNVLYLVPLFIALGVALGAITAVILLKWRDNRRRLLRTSTLLPGPPYVPPENDVEDRLLVHGYPSMEQVSLFAAATPSKFTVHGSRYIPKRTFAWQAQPPLAQPTHTQTIIPSSDGEKFTVVTEEDPFLVPMVAGRSPQSSTDASLPQIRVSPSVPDPTPGDKSSHLTAENANSPKLFRRSMFDILRLNAYRPAPSAHKEYSVLVPEEEPVHKTMNGVRRVSSLKTTVAGEHRARSARRSLDGGVSSSGTEDALGLLGSQGEKKNAPVVLSKQALRLDSPTQSEKTKTPRKVTPFASQSKGSPKEAFYSEDESINTHGADGSEEKKHPDIYTKAPQRRHSRTSRNRLSSDGASGRSSAPDSHASVLPRSPPSLMSPPLEQSLFFTSPSSSASLASRMNALAATYSSPPHHADKSPEQSLFPLPSRKKTKVTKKLRTKRPEPPLPYPSYPNHAHAQSTPRQRSPPVDIQRQSISVSPGSPKPKGRATSAAHRESTTGIWSLGSLSQTSLAIALASSSSSDMLDKVNDIVALGYTKKRTSVGVDDGLPGFV